MPSPRQRALTAVPLALLLSACAHPPLHANALSPAYAVETAVESFPSNGHDIRVDVYRPTGTGRHPAAIVLHGSGGIHSIAPSASNRYAYALAEMGIAAFVVHYFDGTGHFSADDDAERQFYFDWVREVKDAVTWARARRDVVRGRVSLVGQSLGAWVAVGAAALDARVYRVALFGAGLEPFLADSLSHMPPALLFHGDQDHVVPLSDAQHLVRLLTAHRHAAQLVVYPGEDHELSDSAATDALVRTARFVAPRRGR